MRHIMIRPGFMEGLPLERPRLQSGEAMELGLSLPGQMLIIAWRNIDSPREAK
jgi:hypothetical protein